MNYRETLEWMFARLPMYHRIGPAAYKPNLDNTLALLENLGNPHRRFQTVHVGGTNGKGSVSHILAAIFQAAGLKTGLYISPHYRDFRERIKINGRPISQKAVVDFVEKNQLALDQIEPSFFEMTVGLAFDQFARQKIDIAVIEVGLGGRLDSTNVITPLASVITNISFDHMALLGDSLEKIAAEKAGIIKPGVPLIVGETGDESSPVFQKKADETGSPIFWADQNFGVIEISTDWKSTIYDIFFENNCLFKNLRLAAAGPFQEKNLATALQTIQVLNDQRLPVFLQNETPILTEKTIRTGLENLRSLTGFQGRWQVIGEKPTVLCDSAHNEAGLKMAFSAIEKMNFKRLHIVCGFVNDKDLEAGLALFPPSARYFFAKANIPRGLDARMLKERAADFGLRGRAYSSVKNALKAARRAAGPGDLVLVVGSIFVVAEVLPALGA